MAKIALLLVLLSAFPTGHANTECPAHHIYFKSGISDSITATPMRTFQMATMGRRKANCAEKCYETAGCKEATIQGLTCSLFSTIVFDNREVYCDEDIRALPHGNATPAPPPEGSYDRTAIFSITCIQCRVDDAQKAANAKCNKRLLFQVDESRAFDTVSHDSTPFTTASVATVKECATKCWSLRHGAKWWIHDCVSAQFVPSASGTGGTCNMFQRGAMCRNLDSVPDLTTTNQVFIGCLRCQT